MYDLINKNIGLAVVLVFLILLFVPILAYFRQSKDFRQAQESNLSKYTNISLIILIAIYFIEFVFGNKSITRSEFFISLAGLIVLPAMYFYSRRKVMFAGKFGVTALVLVELSFVVTIVRYLTT